ncbi:response regulator [Fusobacterium sp. IOR10]|uniref:response regulator n=1 Tax=Fusobacterium sp. IOR10 TaxID=2665157 RepID=UPI0013D4100B|nr:response regulator [Fusobacterium sp. IOR10]
MKTVMIVDDALFMRKTIKKMFERAGYEVVAEAENGKEALDKYMTKKPDVITMDIAMPVMDGLLSLKEILKIDETANVLMVSAIGQEELVGEALACGAKGFIVKPFTEELLMSAVDQLF